jgi:hypothetical protein
VSSEPVHVYLPVISRMSPLIADPSGFAAGLLDACFWNVSVPSSVAIVLVFPQLMVD